MTKEIYTNSILQVLSFASVLRKSRVEIISYHVRDNTFPHFPLKVIFLLFLHQDQRMLLYKSDAISYSVHCLQNVLVNAQTYSSLLAFGELSPSPFQEALSRAELDKIFDPSQICQPQLNNWGINREVKLDQYTTYSP